RDPRLVHARHRRHASTFGCARTRARLYQSARLRADAAVYRLRLDSALRPGRAAADRAPCGIGAWLPLLWRGRSIAAALPALRLHGQTGWAGHRTRRRNVNATIP